MGTSWENWGTSWVKQAKTMKKTKEILGQTLKNTSKNNWNQPESLQTPQEAPRQPPGSPKRAQNLQKAPPRDPKPSQKGPQMETKISKNPWKIDPGGPQSPQELPRSPQERFFIDFWSILSRFGDQFWEQKPPKNSLKYISILTRFFTEF